MAGRQDSNMKITESKIRRIIREELLIESPIDIPGLTGVRMDPMTQAEMERTGAADILRQQRMQSTIPTLGELIIDFGSAIVMGTVEFAVDAVNARIDLQVNLMQAAQAEPGSEEQADFLTQATNNALDIAIANLMWYGPGIAFKGLSKGGQWLWPAIKNAKPSSRAVPTSESQSLLKEFRANLLTDDFIAAAGSDRSRLQKAADIIDDAIKANDKFKYQRPSYSAAVKNQRARDAIVKMRDEMDDLYMLQAYARGENSIYAGGKPPPMEKIRWDHIVKVSNQTLPPSVYPVFAEKILRGMNYSRLTPKNLYAIYEDAVENTIAGSQAGHKSSAFIYTNIVKYWEKIPGNPAGKGFKDYKPQAYGFHIDDVITRSEAEAIAAEMFEQFPGISKLYGSGPVALADDIQQLVIKAGHKKGDILAAHGNYGAYSSGDVIEMAPWASADELAAAVKDQGGVISTIKSALRDEGTYAHEFDHWLRNKVVRATGGNVGGARSPTIKSGSRHEKWLSKHTEFEAEFTKSIKEFLDEILERGWSDELNVALTKPSKFETYFLQNMQDREWLGAAGKDGIKHVRRRLFDTESGLYYSLRRAMGIADPPRGPLPETVYVDTDMWNIIAGLA